MVTKAERKAALQSEINEVLSDVEPMYRPSPYQYYATKGMVDWSDGCDPDGYFNGTCPLSPRRKPHLARFNFDRGVMQCTSGCHGDKGNFISLVNAASRTHG